MKNAWPIISKDAIARVTDVLERGILWRGAGDSNIRFERQFADLHECAYGLTVTNGTHALEVALEAIGLQYGDEVLVPAFTFIASAVSVLQRNAFPIPVDVDFGSANMNVNLIEQLITPRT